MNKKIIYFTTIILVVVVAATSFYAGIQFGSPSQQQKGTILAITPSPMLVPTGTRRANISVPASSFSPEGSILFEKDSFSLRNMEASGFEPFYAPVQLPQGATITKIYLYVLDSSPSFDILLKLIRRDTSPNGGFVGGNGPGGGFPVVATVSSSGNSGFGSFSSLSDPAFKVVYNNYLYSLHVLLPSATSAYFIGAFIEYESP
jgi:hypothetical protein